MRQKLLHVGLMQAFVEVHLQPAGSVAKLGGQRRSFRATSHQSSKPPR